MVSHLTELDGSVTSRAGGESKRWVYTRDDGTEFVDLKSETPVRRVDAVAHIDTYCKAIKPVPMAEVLANAAGTIPVNLGGGLAAFVKKVS